MDDVSPTPLIPFDDEKNPRIFGSEAAVLKAEVKDLKAEAGVTAKPVDSDSGSSDGDGDGDNDDAIELAGTHAHHFDEKYYLRLRRKIVSHLELKHYKSTT